MQNGKTSMNTIFDGDKIFAVPNYQRAYAWQEKNLSDFFGDIDNQVPGKNYFFGTFLFHKRGRSGDYEIIDVVDGQQRLTTYVVFMDVLLQKLIASKSKVVTTKAFRRFIKDDEIYKLQLCNDDNSLFHSFVLGSNSKRSRTAETPSQRNLVFAKTYFNKALEGANLDDLERYYFIATEAEALLYVVDDITSAVQIFELINDRGRRLSDLESIKSFLMYMIGLDTENSSQPIMKVQEDFSGIYRVIESNSLVSNDVLRYHTIAFESCLSTDYDNPKNYIKNKIIKIRRGNKPVTDEILSYSSRLRESFQIFAEIKKNKINSPCYNELLMIGRVAPFYPLIMKVYKESPLEIEILLKALVSFTFRASLVGLRSNGESDLYAAIREKKNLVQMVNTMVTNNWWNINKRCNEVLEYRNFYEWLSKNVVKFILFDYENYLRQLKGFPGLSIKDYFSEDPRTGLSIEHITAKKAKELKLSEAFKENYLHSLGNLVIDSKASNSSKSNKNPAKKREQFAGAPLMSQNEINKSKVKWDNLASVKGFIDLREATLKQFVREKWGIA